MDGIHDVGGMEGFGPVDPEAHEHEGTFHHRWEGEVHGTFVGTLGNGLFNMDEFRHAIERMDPEFYLGAAYYDRWLTAITTLLVEKGVLDPADIEDRAESVAAGEAELPDREDPDLVSELVAGVVEAYSTDREGRDPSFDVGDDVRVRNIHPKGHTRCPRYIRRARGVVAAHRGTHVLPDANAHGEERAEPVYNVAFTASELWDGDYPDTHRVHLELWEPYLEPV